ncbi:MAG: aminotransferase class V-fold PLP-dependent enzyme [Actinomycetota bacterium]|nr:aminotransferase class V-fold PLP-dependent enzyme [Actinomycetota bacterium]
MDGSALRARFPIFERLTYVNSCSQGALSDAVRQSYEDYLRDWDEKGAPWDYWVDRTEAARTAFAGLINADPDEIAVTTSVSAGVASLASGLRFASRSKVVLTELEFPTIGQIWHAQEARGARVTHVEPDAFEPAIDEDTLLVSTTHVSYRTGAMIDVPAVVGAAHDKGALVLLDAYQTVGSLPVDVKALDVDFLAAGVLKYLLGSAGLAFFYCRRELWERAWPTATGWFADEDIFKMDIHDYSPSPTARRFQSGTPPIPSIYAGIAGIELMEEIGIAETREHVLDLNDRLIAGVDDLGGKIATPRERDQHGALICIPSTDVSALVAALDERGIVTSERDGNLRVSAHAYNTEEDMDAVLEALRDNRALLA